MHSDLYLEVKKLSRSMSVLIVDDDSFTVDLYKSIFSELFLKVFTASDGAEAYEIWRDQAKNIDLIITDIMMPKVNGFELINKIREHSNSQHIIVVSSLDDLNEMRTIINLGIDGIILKPYDQEKALPILNRILDVIKTKKIMKRQIFQLKLLSQDNINLKVNAKTINKEIPIKASKDEEKSTASLSSKYSIRTTVVGADANALEALLDYKDTDNADELIHSIEEYESLIVTLESKPLEEILESLISSTQAIQQLIELMQNIGSFTVAVEAGENLIIFIENINVQMLVDPEKKELFFDTYLSMFQDIGQWLQVIFINKEASNINYFDASFANTCLELETIFMETVEDDSELDFF